MKAPKSDKPKVAHRVVQIIFALDPPGRFLAPLREEDRNCKNKETILWYDVGYKKARAKASQCLRERKQEHVNYDNYYESNGRNQGRLKSDDARSTSGSSNWDYQYDRHRQLLREENNGSGVSNRCQYISPTYSDKQSHSFPHEAPTHLKGSSYQNPDFQVKQESYDNTTTFKDQFEPIPVTYLESEPPSKVTPRSGDAIETRIWNHIDNSQDIFRPKTTRTKDHSRGAGYLTPDSSWLGSFHSVDSHTVLDDDGSISFSLTLQEEGCNTGILESSKKATSEQLLSRSKSWASDKTVMMSDLTDHSLTDFEDNS